MRRRVLLATLALPFPIALAAHGCSSGPPIEDYCAFLRNPDSCYSAFHEDLGAKCGFDNEMDAKGTFGMRAMLDVCILTAAGGQVVFDPPLDITKFPPTDPLKVKLVAADGIECGSVEITSSTLFSITINPPPGADADAGSGDAGSAEGPLLGGTFSVTSATNDNILDLSCPAPSPTATAETHRFNGFQLTECAAFTDIAPRAVMEADPGGVQRDGLLRLKIHYPPALGTGLGGTDPRNVEGTVAGDVVTYFDCRIPPALPIFQDGIKNASESDIDCGGPADTKDQPVRCQTGQACICNDDCANALCSVDPMSGAKKCSDSGNGVPCL
jgi:hypothetical protein